MSSVKRIVKLDKCLKHEHIHLSPSQSEINAKIYLSNITLDYRHMRIENQACKLKIVARGANVRILVPSEWYVKIRGRISLTLLDNYTETYHNDKPCLEVEIESVGTKMLIINELYR